MWTVLRNVFAWRKTRTVYVERNKRFYPVFTEYVRISPSRLVIKALCIVALVTSALAVILVLRG